MIPPRTLAPLLLQQARLSNRLVEVLSDAGVVSDNARETLRDIACELVESYTDATFRRWQEVCGAVATLDAFRDDPGASDGMLTEDACTTDVDSTLYDLMTCGAAWPPCFSCRALVGWRDGVVEVPAAGLWAQQGECPAHTVTATSDPWADLAGAA